MAQIYENFTPMVMMSLEDHHFVKRSKGGAFVEDGRIEWPNGEIPINTSGGNLAEAYIYGFELVLIGGKADKGQFSTCQVKDAEICLMAGETGTEVVSDLI